MSIYLLVDEASQLPTFDPLSGSSHMLYRYRSTVTIQQQRPAGRAAARATQTFPFATHGFVSISFQSIAYRR
ncbi:hypothetical protein [Pseudomonas yangonensis]|uniref:hypothetical protein n=1 Tax=Pseudomonas yangonensis TaxID=2579922 RepID=UPI0013796CED|nr:hypothetical protein [Pseudomonas yangonensis]